MQRSSRMSAALRSLWESAYRKKSTRGWNLYRKCDVLKNVVLVGSGGVSTETGIVHTPGPVCLIAKIYAWQHLYYHLSRPDSHRLMLLVSMFAKLILSAFRETSNLHATFAMADHPPDAELAAPTLPSKMGMAPGLSCQTLGLFLEGSHLLNSREMYLHSPRFESDWSRLLAHFF